MRSHGTVAADRKSVFRASLLGIAMLVTLAITSTIASGCGGTPQLSQAPEQQTPPVSAPQPANVGTVDQLANQRSLHEMVMAEQSGERGVAAAVDPTTTTLVTSGAQLVASAFVNPPVERNDPSSVVRTGGETPLRGTWSGTAERLASFLLKACPSPHFTVPTSVLADYYVRYCAEAGLRADLLWAQMIHETGYGMFGGAVAPEQNNYAGIGATGGGEQGVAFATAEAGVMAQVAHMVAYVYASSPVAWANETVDPRFDLVAPRGAVSVLHDLDGRWAVPGTSYGEAVEGIARAINSD